MYYLITFTFWVLLGALKILSCVLVAAVYNGQIKQGVEIEVLTEFFFSLTDKF